MTLLRTVTPALHKLDHAIGRLTARRDVLVEMRTPVYHAVLSPIADALAVEPNVNVWYTSEYPDRLRPLVPPQQFLTHDQVEWRRFDAYVNGDPWAAARLRRCAHRVCFFHGVAGKYDLDNPAGLPMGFEYYSHIAFINRDRGVRTLMGVDTDHHHEIPPDPTTELGTAVGTPDLRCRAAFLFRTTPRRNPTAAQLASKANPKPGGRQFVSDNR